MAQPRRLIRFCVPVLLSWLCAVETGCQCSFSCAPTFKGPNCGPNGCGGGAGGGYGGPNCGPAGAGQWAQTGRDASQQPGQWGQGCNTPMGGGYAQAPAYPVMQQGYQPAVQPAQQQQQAPVQLGPTPMPERAPDRMPNAQGNNNMMVPCTALPRLNDDSCRAATKPDTTRATRNTWCKSSYVGTLTTSVTTTDWPDIQLHVAAGRQRNAPRHARRCSHPRGAHAPLLAGIANKGMMLESEQHSSKNASVFHPFDSIACALNRHVLSENEKMFLCFLQIWKHTVLQLSR